ncbi:MAG: phosphoenolpyruvate--protein phosphotransferase, partial [Clostridiaceae bacterium]|nr:phosphoenolpyruvate--protein phosphotransferase [Clostridiaceae bacterium]
MHKELKGISISKGIAIGEAYKIIKLTKEISYERIGESAVEAEKARFLNALEQTREQVNALSKHMRDKHEDQKAEIIETQLTILEDPEIEDSVCAKIADERKNAEWALKETHQALQEMFSEFEDERMRERLSDINDVCSQIMGQLQGGTVGQSGGLPDSCVIVAEELTPSETVSLDFDKTAGFLTHVGGATSHMAIISRSMGIPAIAGIADVMHEVNSGDTVILDATIGMVIVNPDEGELRAYEEKKKELEHRKVLLEKLRDLPALTKDGVRVELCANIGSTKDAETAIVCGGDGVGLCRTEFLYMNNTHFPTEEEQFAAYRTIAQTLKGKPVVVRTLDIGGDKDLSYFEFEKEDNPFLGWRAIRICLDRTDIFKTQLRAILRAGAYGNLRLMYPMIIAKEELMRANEILEECKSELSA